MTKKQREEIAATIAILDMASLILRDFKSGTANAVVDKAADLRMMLEEDCPAT